MTKENFLLCARYEVACLSQAFRFYPCEQLKINSEYVQNAIDSVLQMDDGAFSSWWRVMHSDFEFLEVHISDVYIRTDGEVPF